MKYLVLLGLMGCGFLGFGPKYKTNTCFGDDLQSVKILAVNEQSYDIKVCALDICIKRRLSHGNVENTIKSEGLIEKECLTNE